MHDEERRLEGKFLTRRIKLPPSPVPLTQEQLVALRNEINALQIELEDKQRLLFVQKSNCTHMWTPTCSSLQHSTGMCTICLMHIGRKDALKRDKPIAVEKTKKEDTGPAQCVAEALELGPEED